METIISALTTPNQGLINILLVPLMFLETFINMLLFTTILNIRTDKKQKSIYICIYSLCAIVTKILFPNTINGIINIFLNFGIIYFVLKPGLGKSIIACFIPVILQALLESLLLSIASFYLNTPLENIINIPIFRISMMLIIYLFNFLLYKIIKYFRFDFDFNVFNKTTNKKLLLSNFILGIITIGIQVYLITYFSGYFPLCILFLSIFSLIAYFSISVYSLYKNAKLEVAMKDLENSKLYNKTLSILYDNIRAFKHDFNNIVQAIGGYVATKDLEGLEKYYSQLLDDCQRVNNLTTLNPEVINNPSIFSILASKYHFADENGIKINLEVFLDLNTINMKIYELTRVLGILLDNSIEASSECEEKVINVIFRKDFNSPRQLIIIENTYKNKDIDTEKIFEKDFTTKERNTGLGLWEVRKILKKNTNLNLFTSKTNEYFRQQLEIYNN